jgi:hypothetical protein
MENRDGEQQMTNGEWQIGLVCLIRKMWHQSDENTIGSLVFGHWTLLALYINLMMNDLSQLLQLMQDDPAKFQGLSIEKISRFIDYTTLLKRDILLTESALHPESELPP